MIISVEYSENKDQIKPLVVNEVALKAHIEIMQNDSSECLKKVRVDVHSGEGFYAAQVSTLVNVLQERCVEKIIEDSYDR